MTIQLWLDAGYTLDQALEFENDNLITELTSKLRN